MENGRNSWSIALGSGPSQDYLPSVIVYTNIAHTLHGIPFVYVVCLDCIV